MSEQPRVQKGIPTGGQYSTTEKQDDAIGSPSAPQTDGTFYFPPVFEKPEDIPAFWMNVEIPDVALSRLAEANRDAFNAAVGPGPIRWWAEFAEREWLEENPEPSLRPGLFSGKTHPHRVWTEAKEAARQEFLDRKKAEFTAAYNNGVIPRGSERAAVRVLGMYESLEVCGKIHDREWSSVVNNTPIVVAGGEHQTVRDLASKMPATTPGWRVHRHMVLDMRDDDDPAKVAQRLQEQNRVLADQLAKVAASVQAGREEDYFRDQFRHAGTNKDRKKVLQEWDRTR